MNTVLVTGGAGYIGSHTCVELLKSNYRVVVVDNLRNSNVESLKRVGDICGKKPEFCQVDLLDVADLRKVFSTYQPEAVIHFAALKSVAESVRRPLMYYYNNVTGTLNLLDCMKEVNCKKLIFSSSATVYGQPEKTPVTENCKLMAVNPYGNTKLIAEQICQDLVKADPSWKIVILRYFNPIGAHPSGKIGEDPHGIPNNLMPYLLKVANGELPYVTVHGNDWSTVDGTGVRDYIHVVDLSLGHLSALNHIDDLSSISVFNLGTGQGFSVLQVIDALQKVTGKTIPYQIGPRRPGDISICYADPTKAEQMIKWKATRGISDMCLDSWRWRQNNPHGYDLR